MTKIEAWQGARPALARGTRPHIPRARTAERAPDPRPAAGHYLLAGIDAVLARLTDPEPATGQLADELRTALARTAACGDTCRVRAAADDVRLAANLLLSGWASDAGPLLARARAALLSRPAGSARRALDR